MARSYYKYRKKRKNKVRRFLLVLLALCLSAYFLLALGEELGIEELPTIDEIGAVLSLDGGASGGAGKAADCEVHFIDVGQGDSTLIRSDGSNILIDAGENDQGKTVMDYLKALKIKKIDTLIMTHPHSDHIGGMDTVIENFDIGKIVMPRLPDEMVPTTKTYTDVLMAIAEKGLKITPSKVGSTYAFGAGTITVLGPAADYDDLNNTSLVCRFEYGGKRFLFTGDMEKPVEGDLLQSGSDVKADVLKAGHHGSKTSTSPDFYKAVDPAVCVISVGDGNSYGHPNKETMKTMKTNGARIYRTDYQGTVVVTVSGGELQVRYENQER